MKQIGLVLALTLSACAAPSCSSESPHASAGVSTDVTLALDLYQDKYLYVSGEIAGTQTDIVIDSGAGITVVDKALADQIGLVGEGEITALGVGGERTVKLANDVTIKLGSLTLAPMTVAILDLGEVHEKLGRRMPLILGKELFHAYPVTIDYANRSVIVHDPEHFEPPTDALAVPARSIEQGHVAIEAQLEDLAPAWFMVDTGSGGTVDFHTPYVTANGLLQRYPRQAAHQVGGVGGMLQNRIAVARSFTLAGRKFESVPIEMAITEQGAFSAETSSGTIGAGLLSRFDLTFDLAHDRIFFRPGEKVGAPFPKDRLGLTCAVHDGRTRVDFVVADSPAANAGVNVGDEITAVDGVALEGGELRERVRAVMHEPTGTSVRLRMRDGTQRVVQLADYF